ncbi:MAG: hypothetical protein MZV64_42235 [Ignavibacteriales bacterium]|nr:hypothetical protein [Ignavibacteriales bacterium]
MPAKTDEHQGARAPLRLPDPRDHPAAAPHVRHAHRPRGHPRAGQGAWTT